MLAKICKRYINYLVALIVANILYYLGLMGCNDDARQTMQGCIDYIVSISSFLAFGSFASTFIYCICAYFAFKRKIYLIFIVSPLNLGVWFYFRHSMSADFSNHDIINILISLVSICFLIFLWLIASILVLTVKSRFAFFLVCILVAVFYYIGFSVLSLLNCSSWPLNFKNSEIDNKVGCKVGKPNYCWDILLNGVFDFSEISGLSCDAQFTKTAESLSLYKYTDMVFFPKVTSWNTTERGFDYFKSKLRNELVLVNFTDKEHYFNNNINGELLTSKETIIKHFTDLGHEIYLDFTNKHRFRVGQTVNYNETLAAKSREAFNKEPYFNETAPKIKNLLFIFVDTVSRAHFKLSLPKTYSFLERYFENKDSSMEAFQFTKYNTIKANTMASALPLLFGDSVDFMYANPERTPKENIFDIYRRRGFINSFITNSCSTLPPWYFKSMNLFNLSQASPFDHENFQTMCDPSLEGSVLGGKRTDSSYFTPYKRCFNGDMTSNYVFDYSNKVLDTYKDSHHFQLLYFLDGHESTNENLKNLDQPLLKYLQRHMRRIIEEEWGVIFYSDHGNHCSVMNLIFNLDDISKDKVLPFLSVLLPRKIADQYRQGLKMSENELISPFDIHQMLASLVGSQTKTEVYSKQIDMFTYNSDSMQRKCSDLKIEDKECMCK